MSSFDGASLNDLRAMIASADPSGLDAVASKWSAVHEALRQAQEDLLHHTLAATNHWQGAAADAFSARADELHQSLGNGAAYAFNASSGVSCAADSLRTAQAAMPAGALTIEGIAAAQQATAAGVTATQFEDRQRQQAAAVMRRLEEGYAAAGEIIGTPQQSSYSWDRGEFLPKPPFAIAHPRNVPSVGPSAQHTGPTLERMSSGQPPRRPSARVDTSMASRLATANCGSPRYGDQFKVEKSWRETPNHGGLPRLATSNEIQVTSKREQPIEDFRPASDPTTQGPSLVAADENRGEIQPVPFNQTASRFTHQPPSTKPDPPFHSPKTTSITPEVSGGSISDTPLPELRGRQTESAIFANGGNDVISPTSNANTCSFPAMARPGKRQRAERLKYLIEDDSTWLPALQTNPPVILE